MVKKIKSFEQACKAKGVDPNKLPDVSMIPVEHQEAIINFYKLTIITSAINKDWTPDYTNPNQKKYYPWFWVKATKEKPAGVGFVATLCAYAHSITALGSRLCFSTSEDALYAAKQFEDLYKGFLLVGA